LIKSVLFKDTKQISAEYFHYPPLGMNELVRNLAKKIIENNGKIMINNELSEISIKDNKIEHIRLNKGMLRPDYLISTIPLDSLAEIIKFNGIKIDKPEIHYQDLNIVYFILNKPKALKDCWIFFPEGKFIFQRVCEQKAFSEATCPENKTAIMVETTQSLSKELINQIIGQLEEAKILQGSEIEEYFFKTIKKAYPIYKKGFAEQINSLLSKVESIDNFYTLGRQGLFNYNNMDQCWDMSMKLAEQIKQNKSKEDWQNTKKYFDSYRIVD